MSFSACSESVEFAVGLDADLDLASPGAVVGDLDLRVAGLEAPGLALRDAVPSGTAAAILGFPLNGPYDVRPARMGQARRALTDDAYGRGPVTRPIAPLRGLVRHGNSGGPIVDEQGRVVGTVFASTTGGQRPGGYAVPNEVVKDVLAGIGRARATVSTGPCAR
jgi:S1-C subfamily serine protease